ncbi:MAG TPA: exonuclease SbcCD subunit D [Methanomicrobia archaeon]|mgnify:CR=1 FL=1|nr:exonuclease SbcCD subunit D [Methanomicrobia archaeon]
MVRILHVADTHIGYSAYRRIDDETGLNQREVDTYDAFRQFVEYALIQKPDLILHAGDLFDSVRPTNRAIAVVLEQLLRLNAAGISFVVIAGNHETPRLKETGSVFSLFEHIPHVHAVYKDRYETVELDGVTVHAIPHCDNIEREKQQLRAHNDRAGINIALLHASVYGAGKQTFLMDEFNEQLISIHDLLSFDYIALGHYHGYTRIRDDVYYAGSTERFSFTEVREQKGFLEVTLYRNGERSVRFHELQTRAMVDLEPVLCTDLTAQEIRDTITERIRESAPEDKVVRLKVLHIPLQVYHTLDFEELKRLTRNAVHFEIKYELQHDEHALNAEHPSFRSLRTEFEHFMEHYAIRQDLDKNLLKELGLAYLQKDEEGEEGET